VRTQDHYVFPFFSYTLLLSLSDSPRNFLKKFIRLLKKVTRRVTEAQLKIARKYTKNIMILGSLPGPVKYFQEIVTMKIAME
jgi:hypothetical protein